MARPSPILILGLSLCGCPAITDTELAARIDQDGDGYIASQFGGADCDDQDSSVHPDAIEAFYDGVDQDCDGASDYDADGDGADTATHGGTDCDDSEPTVHPGAAETCDGLDNDCDGDLLWNEADDDNDGWMLCEDDCDDDDPEVNPGVAEICDDDNTDEDCDGDVDDGDLDVEGKTAWYQDDDQDGYGDPEISRQACDEPVGFVDNDQDCDDSDAAINPETWWYGDSDSDGYGDELDAIQQCEQPSGHVLLDTDCNDSDASVNPGADEVCGGGDEDCDGTVDEDDSVDADTWYADTDGDGYGDGLNTTTACETPSGYTSDNTDCNDTQSTIHPGADERCGGDDEDCDGLLDDDDPNVTGGTDWYLDGDSDGYGDDGVVVVSCLAPARHVSAGGDCDDTDSSVNPGASELCGGGDEDCDGTVDEDDATDATTWYLDHDSDGYGDSWTATTACTQPTGYVADATDCDDRDEDINPAATEICNEEDDDCDGLEDDDDPSVSAQDAWYLDADGDNWGDDSSAVASCEQPSGYVAAAGDCDDSDSGVNPGATETCGDGVDNDCDGTAMGCAPSGDSDVSASTAAFYGEVAGDRSGCSVSLAGDIDADGYDDILIGAYSNDEGGLSAGAAYVIYGPVSGDVSLGAADSTLLGTYPDMAGGDVSGAGDTNGDGYDDLLIGAPSNQVVAYGAGAAYLVLGPVSGDFDLTTSDARLLGQAESDFVGHAVSSAGDLNADGIGDVIVGHCWNDEGGIYAGGAFVLHGPLSGDISLGIADALLIGEAAGDNAGQSIASAGDHNGDGFSDILIGAPSEDTMGSRAGAAYLVLGPVSGDIDLSSADAKFTGEAEGDLAGWRVKDGGDTDGDGYNDLLIAADYNDEGGDAAGAVYLVLGPATTDANLSDAHAKFIGEDDQHLAGFALSSAGDMDSDGYDDILIGAIGHDEEGTNTGAAYLVYGPVTGDLDLRYADATWFGADEWHTFGMAISGDGDVNGDGLPDVLIGTYCDDDEGYEAGATFLFASEGM